MRPLFRTRKRFLGPLAAVAALGAALGIVAAASGAHGPRNESLAAFNASANATAGSTGAGIAPGKIKHVWLIILENKSYDATFTGLNNNTYLWKTLPSQGVLLKNYYGTGHFSLDNYTSMVSGQATQPDMQADCPFYNEAAGTVDTTGSLASNPNYGQFRAAAGANAAPGQNGCVYPQSVQTLFNQLDAAHVSWKGYAQDLGNPGPDSATPSHSAGVQHCGAPYSSPGAAPTPGQKPDSSKPDPGSANATDQYVPKHFPFPWFDAVLKSGDCGAAHIANVFDPASGLYADLQSEATTPTFSWISPNNCSDAHDAVCHGNNLSGGFSDPNTAKAPVNYTGGLYAADLFLSHVVPEIEASPAFKDGGLIDITFDEAFPPFTYTGNSFSNSTKVTPNAAASIASDSAGETINGHTVRAEPTGPNTPLASDPATGEQLYPGPGYNAFVDRPADCVAQTVPAQAGGTCLVGGGSAIPGARTDASAVALAPGGSTIADNSVVATDTGRSVTGGGIPAGAHVGAVRDIPTVAGAAVQNGGIADIGQFTLVDVHGKRLATTGSVSGVTLGARTAATDPLYDATHATTGGGDTGSVLISPYISPGSVSRVFYNHYSWLRTMEDLFQVAGSSPGLDGQGHLGYAAQPGLAAFGTDVFNHPQGQ